ncbi:MAG: glycosyl transferase family 1 [Phycisphaerae bacterium]|nr:MAG: glycosyl transferase family 1 [Phycisphaerae bacterium]
MHVLYVHQNFPAQFGHIARHLVQKLNWKCTFVSEVAGGTTDGIERVQYKLTGGATRHNHFCSRTFENCIWHCHGVYEALIQRPDLRPDLIVGHSGFGSTLFLRELYPDVPVVNFFEYYYRSHDPDSDMDFRKDLGWKIPQIKYLRSRSRNAMILLDLQNCQQGYTPTRFQKSRFPIEYDSKIRVIFDGVDRSVYHGYEESLRPPVSQRGLRTIAGVRVPADVRVVTYVSRGFESMRGFDVFMKAAKIICERMPNVLFLVVGTDRIAYGGDEAYTGGKTFKQWVLDQDHYDLERIRFVGRLPMDELARTLASTDLHIYLTVPFVLSWSMMDAMSCGAVVLGSDTSPVREMIRDGHNGLLVDFFNPQAIADKACEVLIDPDSFRPLGRFAEQTIMENYSLEAVLPQMLQLYEDALNTKTGLEPPRDQPDGSPSIETKRSNSRSVPKISSTVSGVKPTDILTGKAPPKGWSPFRG